MWKSSMATDGDEEAVTCAISSRAGANQSIEPDDFVRRK